MIYNVKREKCHKRTHKNGSLELKWSSHVYHYSPACPEMWAPFLLCWKTNWNYTRYRKRQNCVTKLENRRHL